MPKPIYLICAESGAEDHYTRRTSLFNIIQAVQFQRASDQPAGVITLQALRLFICSIWKGEPEDRDREFEFETLIHLPGVAPAIVTGRGEFTFDKVFKNINSRVAGKLSFSGSGILVIESRIRPLGKLDWLAHELPILIEELPPAPPEGLGRP